MTDPILPEAPDESAAKRGRRGSIAWKASVAAATKAGTFVLNILLLPAQAHWLGGKTEAGVWLSLVALAMALLLFDFGVGQGVRNSVAASLAKGDHRGAREVMSSSYVLLSAVVLPIALVASVMAVGIDLAEFLRAPSSLSQGHELRVSALILIWSVAIYLLLGIVNAALSAAELTQWPPIVSFTSNLLVLAAITCAPRPAAPASAIIEIAVVQGACMVLPLVAATWVVYGRVLRQLRPSKSLVRRQRMVDLIRPSLMFLAIQVGLLLVNGVNEPIITRIEGPDAVFVYQAYYKIFSMVWIAYGIIVSPVWARMSSSFHRGDLDQLLRLHHTMRRLAYAAAAGTCLLYFTVPYLMRMWLGPIPSDVAVRLAFLVQTTLMVAYYAETCLANATDRLRTQTVVLGIGALIKVPLSLLLGHLTGSWSVVLHINSVILAALASAQFVDNRSWLRGVRPHLPVTRD